MASSTSNPRRLRALALVGALAGCSSQISTAAYVPAPAGQPASAQPEKRARSIRIFTANRGGSVNGAILAFSVKANGNAIPAVDISGPNTELSDAESVALDAQGHVYAANSGGTQVEVFAKSANGNAKPLRTVGGSNSQLGPSNGLLIDPSNDLWVTSYANDWISEYAPGANGNVAPIDVIAGSHTQLDTPMGMARSSGGDLYVANQDSASIVAFAPGASGNATPVVNISGSNTGLSEPFALAFDSNGRLLVANGSTVLVFASGANGNVAPEAEITGFDYAAGVAADAKNHIWVADFIGNTIKEFTDYADHSAPPLRTIQGSKTKLNQPFFLAFN
jgi:hypothetical protein